MERSGLPRLPVIKEAVEPWHEVMRALGRIEARLDKLDNLADRVASLERWQSWLKGGWAALVGAWAYFSRIAYSK